MNNPLISIVIPVYNVEKYLKQCIESVINQSYRNIEIILINDESPDDSLKIIEEFSYSDDRIKFLTQKNTGLSGARNKGIEISTGEYLIFVDSDDWLEKDTCKYIVEKLSDHDYDMVFWSYIREYTGVSSKKDILLKDTFFDEADCRNLHKRIFGLTDEQLAIPENADSIVTAWGKLYKTSLIKNNNINFVDTKLIGTEDALFNCNYFNFVKKAFYLHNHFYHYRRDNLQSLTSISKPNLLKQWTTLYSMMKEIISKYNLNDGYTEALNNRISLSLIGLGLNEMNSEFSNKDKIKNLNSILKSLLHKKALESLSLKYFPLHWKVFFYLAKSNNVIGVFILLRIINYFVNRKK